MNKMKSPNSLQKSLPIIVIGGGGHAKVIIDTLKASSENILGFTNANANIKNILGIELLGTDDFIEKQNPNDVLLALGVGSTSSDLIRKQIFDHWKQKGFDFTNVIHPSAIISSDAKIGEGTQVLMGTTIQAGTHVLENCIINTKASIDHDCSIERHVHIAPGSTLSGGVTIGECSHLGTGTTVIQNIKIASHSTIGAGSVVIRNTESHKIYFGTPAKEFQKNK